MASYLVAVKDTVERLDFIRSEASRQLLELGHFVSGTRQSRVPLGKKFLMNIGWELEQLQKDLEQWIK